MRKHNKKHYDKIYFYKLSRKVITILMVVTLTISNLSLSNIEEVYKGILRFSMKPVTVSAAISKYGYSSDGKWAYKILNSNSKTVSIRPATLAKAFPKKLVIPGQITISKTKYTVVEIADCAFEYCVCKECLKDTQTTLKECWEKMYYNTDDYYMHWGELQEVIIPSGVKTIGEEAFWASELNKITFEKNSQLKKIDSWAFADTEIKEIIIPSGVKTIGEDAFSDSELNKITFEKNSQLQKIDFCAFEGTEIKEITIPSGVKTIEDFALGDCASLKTITFKAQKKFQMSDYVILSCVGEKNTKIKHINIENYDIYDCIESIIDKNVTVYSANTRVFVNGKKYKDIAMGKNKQATINCDKYTPTQAGYHFEYRNSQIEYVDNFNSAAKKYGKITDNKFVSKGYPYVNIVGKKVENYYTIDNPGYDAIKAFDTRETHENDKNVTSYFDKEKNNYHIAYMDRVLFANYPVNMNKKGYHIAGYRITSTKDKKLNKLYRANTMAMAISDLHNDNLKISLEYEPNRYEIAYDGNEGMIKCKNTKCLYDEEAQLTDTVPFRMGYKFKGWSRDKQGKSGLFQPGATVKNLEDKDGESITLYAIWESSLLTVTFDGNGGIVNRENVKVAYGKEIGQLPVPKRDGYEFISWTLGKTGGTVVDSSYNVKLVTDFTIYAQWKEKEINVTFNGNGGTVSNGTKQVKYNKSVGTMPIAERPGYKFDGWYDAAEGGNKISFATRVTRESIYYAHWKQQTKRIQIKIDMKNRGKKISSYQISYTNGKGHDYNYEGPARSGSIVYVTINGAKVGDTYVVKARCYSIRKGKKKQSREITKNIKVE